MIPRHDPIHCIVPPHMLRALAVHQDERLREVAVHTLLESSRLRGRREVLAEFPPPPSNDSRRRAIFDTRRASSLPGVPVRVEGDDDAPDRAVDELAAALGAAYNLLLGAFDRDSIDGGGMELIGSIRCDDGFDNAYWDGRQVVVGQGDGIVFTGFTGAVDVIGHELAHGVVQFTSKLAYTGQSGALNESFSDVFGSLVKQYSEGHDAASADWLIGAGLFAPGIGGAGLRSLKEPGSAYDDPQLGGKDPQPAHMSRYIRTVDDHGGVHLNSGIANRAFYLVAQQLGGHAWGDPGRIWYETLVRLWPTAQFQDCANVSYDVAAECFGTGSPQQQAVAEAWSEVGLPVACQERPQLRTNIMNPVAHANGRGHLKS
jgi:Zn-dependent metalloprotease